MNFTINIHKVCNKTQPIVNPYDILPKEYWKEVDAYSDYLVSQNGDVYSKITCKLLKHHILNSGYALVTLYKGGLARYTYPLSINSLIWRKKNVNKSVAM